MIILGIETSCDDTGIAVVKFGKKKCEVLSSVVSSQIKIHAPYGGVVPNLAARAHLENIKPCLETALEKAGNIKIDLIAVTIGPGLIPSLLVGVNFAKALAYANNIPVVGVNHIEGHIYANWLRLTDKTSGLPRRLRAPRNDIKFPALCLVVSGGHTQLVLMKGHGRYKLLGETRDDAAGEAFDKVAKLLGLGYPGGPIISKRAEKGNSEAYQFPRPMLKMENFDFSFSGLKTAVLYKLRALDTELSEKNINDFSASFQQAVIDVLVAKTLRAVRKYEPETVILCGGVAANKELRKQVKQKILHSKFQVPSPKFCTDNGAMIAAAAFYKKKGGRIAADANLKLFA